MRDQVFPKVNEIFELMKQIIVKKADITDERAQAVMRIQLGIIGSFVFQKYILNIDISENEISRQVEEIISIIQKGCV